MADSFDVQESSVGFKADPPQLGEVVRASADVEVARVVDRGFGAQRAPLLVVLLDAGALVVDVQGGDHAVGDHTGAKSPGGALGSPRGRK